ncbi:MAG: tRNA (adenosine(37)-N6)-threonylcarbamoyltransferase complex ATPase subunit type 1 TsaE [Acetivibrionales bacterium]|jgi:tRNA threonylcarbamoyladenosine biosynthesis protein TsaE
MLRFHSGSVEDTVRLGQRLGKLLQKGDNVCLTGGLGTGKTAFTGGIAKALGISEYITSPTFTIVNEYQGRLPLYHLDVYRIGSDIDEVLDVGYDEYIDGNGVTVIEWADLIRGILPENRIEVAIEKDNDSDASSRLITISFHGNRTAACEGRFLNESAGD